MKCNCPDCGKAVVIESTPEFNERLPWEVYCAWCGWFDETRYTTKDVAEKAALGN